MIAALLLTLSALAADAPAPTTPAIQYVGAVSIQPSQDAKLVADWYTKFGVALTGYGDGGYYGFFQTPAGPFYFAVHPKKANAAEKSSGSVSIVFRVNDYAGYVANVEKRGLKPESTEADESGHFAHYKDPDGNEMTVWGE